MKLHTIDTAVGPIAYRGAGSGPPLLLLHGWGGSSRYWAPAIAGLSGRFSAVAPDLPGFGATEPGGRADLPGLAHAALAVADALGWESFDLIGHSLGAAVSLVLAAAQPGRVRRLGLVSLGMARTPGELAFYAGIGAKIGFAAAIWAPWLLAWRPWAAAWRPWRQLAASTPPLPALLAAPVLARSDVVGAEALAVGAADMAAMDTLAALESAASVGSPIVAALAGRVACPTLAITGEADPIAQPSAAAALAAAIPGARLTVIPGCGHIPMAECPAELDAALGAFLAAA